MNFAAYSPGTTSATEDPDLRASSDQRRRSHGRAERRVGARLSAGFASRPPGYGPARDRPDLIFMQSCPRDCTSGSAAAGARSVIARRGAAAAYALPRPSSDDPLDGGSSSDGMGNLGHLVHHLEQVSKLIGGGIGADFDRIVDARGLPGYDVEPTRRGHADSLQFDPKSGSTGHLRAPSAAAPSAGRRRPRPRRRTGYGTPRHRTGRRAAVIPPQPGSRAPAVGGEDRREDARRVKPRAAVLVDRPVGADERDGVEVADQAVFGDGQVARH